MHFLQDLHTNRPNFQLWISTCIIDFNMGWNFRTRIFKMLTNSESTKCIIDWNMQDRISDMYCQAIFNIVTSIILPTPNCTVWSGAEEWSLMNGYGNILPVLFPGFTFARSHLLVSFIPCSYSLMLSIWNPQLKYLNKFKPVCKGEGKEVPQ